MKTVSLENYSEKKNVLSLNLFRYTVVKKNDAMKSCLVLNIMVNFVRIQNT